MSFNSNGQISYLVLDSLSSGSKYGLEIIEYISKKTNGGYIMKKPTLYSCLTRMEKKGLVSSSYWGESELGGKRHYYSITPAGKTNLADLSRVFSNTTFNSNDAIEEQVENHEKPTILHQGNIFDMVKEQKIEKSKETEQKSDIIENQIDIFNMEPIVEPKPQNDAVFLQEDERILNNPVDEEKISYYQNKLEQEVPVQENVDDGKFLDENERLTHAQEEQNKMIYDTSSELKKYKKRKSFSENQIEMAVVYENEDYEQIQKERIAELKKSLLGMKQSGAEHYEKLPPLKFIIQEEVSSENLVENSQLHQRQEPTSNYFDGLLYQKEYVEDTPTHSKTKIEIEEDPNDAIFITEPRMDEIPIQRKISPPNIEVSLYDDNLPAPKRNSDLEPTYKDMMAKLFEKKKEKEIREQAPQTIQQNYESVEGTNFADYSSLKTYYNSQGITFKEYKRTSVERKHNTNLLNLISSAILLLLSGVGSAILFGIISGTNNLKSGTNFMFYTLPILFLVFVLVEFLIYKFVPSKKAHLRYNAAVNWIIFVLAVGVIFGINAICKMQFETIAQFSTSLFVPILGLLLVLPVDFYIRKFLYKKYGK